MLRVGGDYINKITAYLAESMAGGSATIYTSSGHGGMALCKIRLPQADKISVIENEITIREIVDVEAIGTGDAAEVLIADSSGAIVSIGDIGTGDDAFMRMQNPRILAGGTVGITEMSITYLSE